MPSLTVGLLTLLLFQGFVVLFVRFSPRRTSTGSQIIKIVRLLFFAFCLPALCVCASGQTQRSNRQSKPRVATAPKPETKTATLMRPDLAKEPTLYVVGYAHLDTQWRWEYPQGINEYLPATMRDNFALFEKYPNYLFNFTGANRYRMMKEYWPEDYARLKSYVAAGRWFPAGSSM